MELLLSAVSTLAMLCTKKSVKAICNVCSMPSKVSAGMAPVSIVIITQITLLKELSEECRFNSCCIATSISMVPMQLIINGIIILMENNLKNSDSTIVKSGDEDVDTKPEGVMPQLPCSTRFLATAICMNVSSSG